MHYWNGGLLTATRRRPTSASASGVFDLISQQVFKSENIWPEPYNFVLQGLEVLLDAGSPASYPGSGAAWNDMSGNANNAILIGSPGYISSPGAFDITGDNTYASLSSYSHRQNDFTYSLWVNFDAIGSQDSLFENGSWTDSLLFRVEGSGSIKVYAESQLVGTFSVSLTTGTWYNITYTRSGSANTLYVNGAQSGSAFTNQRDINIANANTFLMRSQHTTSNQYTDGKLAHFAMYTRALTALEIVSNFDAIKARYGY